MSPRLLAGSMIALLLVPGINRAADSRPGKKSSGQVGRAANLVPPKLLTQPTNKLIVAKSAQSTKVAASSIFPGSVPVLAAANANLVRGMLTPQPARAGSLKLPGTRPGSGVLQLVPASEPTSGQKVLTLVPNPPAQILQFSSDDKQEPAATIMPLGTSEPAEPAATLLQFED